MPVNFPPSVPLAQLIQLAGVVAVGELGKVDAEFFAGVGSVLEKSERVLEPIRGYLRGGRCGDKWDRRR